MIDWGLPDTREAWPSGVLDALRHWRQGDLVAQPPAFHYCDPEAAVWAGRPEGLNDPDVVDWGPLAPPLGIVTTQTCDVAEEDATDPRRPFVQLAPVYDMSTELNSGLRKLLKQRRGPLYLFHVPGVEDWEGFFVADLRLEFPVDKGWLAGRQRVSGFGDELDRERFGDRLGALRVRPAFHGDFVASVQQSFVEAVRSVKSDDAELFEVLDRQVAEFGVRMDSRLHPTTAEPWFLCDHEPSDRVRAWLSEWWDEASGAAADVGIQLQAMRVVTFDEITARQLRSLTTVPLVRFSAG